MPRKEINLLARDIRFYLFGGADVAAADWQSDDWVYPLDWGYQLDREADYFDPKDEHGIPLHVYGGGIGVQYLPSRVAGFALAHWNRWRVAGDASNRSSFLMAADWFRDAPDNRYLYDFAVAGITPPWISCIAQGEGGSILARAFVETGDPAYREAAARSMEPLKHMVGDGGVQDRLPDGSPFLEEYPGSIYRHVLNGCLYGVIGMHDVLRVLDRPDEQLASLLQQVTEAVVANIEAWSVGGWTSYDYPKPGERRRNLNTMTYQTLQSILVRYVGEIRGEPRLIAAADRWSRAAASPFARSGAMVRKIAYRLSHRY